MSLQVVILAAGQGKRMCSTLPKVLHPLAGRPLLKHVLDTARALYPEKLVVVYGYGGQQVQSAFSNQTDIFWVEQSEQQGTGHAVQQALPHLEGKGVTLVLYGDVPLISPTTLMHLYKTAQGAKTLALLTNTLKDPTGYGRIVRDDQNHVIRIVEHQDATVDEKTICEINTGLFATSTVALGEWLSELKNNNAQGEYYLTDIIELAVRDGFTVHSIQPRTHWEAEGANDPIQLAQLERYYQQEQAHFLLKSGVQLADPNRIDIRGIISHGQDVYIDVNCVFEGQVQLGNHVSIGANCVLKNVSLGDHVIIHPFCHLEDAEIGPRSLVGPYARLRPGTRLAAEVQIGNFVEIKKATIGPNSKVNHLTYIGDTLIGNHVNIGAGTITCNYDGINKSQTTIGDHAFIGSNTSLVAPVTIGAGATVGAGSVITRSVPDGQLSLTRSEQKTLPGWIRPKK